MSGSAPWYDGSAGERQKLAGYLANYGDGPSRIVAASQAAAPTAAAGASNGTTPPAPVVAASATDLRGSVTFGSGGTPAAGAQCVVTFHTAYATAPTVSLDAGNSATAALNLYVTATTTGFTINTVTAPTASQANTVYAVNYIVVG